MKKSCLCFDKTYKCVCFIVHYTGITLKAEQNDRKVTRSQIKKKGVTKMNPNYKGLLPVKSIRGPWQKGPG